MKAIIERINKSNTLSNSKNSLNKPETTKKPIIINNSSILKKIAEMQNKYKSEQIEKMNNLIKKNEFYKQKESTPKKNGIDSAIEKKLQNLENINKNEDDKKYIHNDVLNKTNIKNESINSIIKNIQFENIDKNIKLKNLNEQNLKNIYGNNENEKNKLTFQNQLHLFDRKITNYEKKEKIKLKIGLKNPDLNSKYLTTIYNDKGNIIGKSDKLNETNNFIFDNNLIVDYDFTKEQFITLIINKIINEIEEKISEKKIILNKILKPENYEEEIPEFVENEILNIGCDNNDEEEEEYIQIFFNNNNNNYNEDNNYYNEMENISYSIQKDDKIIFKSAFCKYTYLKESDKLPIHLLEPEFELSFYNENFEEKKIKIKVDDLKNGFPAPVCLPNTKPLNLNIKSEKKEITPINKLLNKGLHLKLNIAIDFTGSNGDPKYKNSLHYIDDKTFINYEKAIKTSFRIISYHTENDDCDVYGFGAEVKNQFKYIFNINNQENPSIKGINNIIEEYKKTVLSVSFSGGTYFAPVINEVNNKIKTNQNELNYYILLIITDGIIDDIHKTIDCIIESSKLPLSIIIIGVGNYINQDMKTLNGENGKIISSKNEELKKDIIQYVHFNDYAQEFDKLNDAVFKYIPQQISDYYLSKQNSLSPPPINL